MRLSDVRPGRWYQFRVAAVNTHGTRGFTTPSKHIHSSRGQTVLLYPVCDPTISGKYCINSLLSHSDPSNPPAPAELRVSNMSFGPGRAAAARVQWSMPADLDVPVHHYKVTWSWTTGRQSSLSKRRKVVREVRSRQMLLCLSASTCLCLPVCVCVFRARWSWTAYGPTGATAWRSKLCPTGDKVNSKDHERSCTSPHSTVSLYSCIFRDSDTLVVEKGRCRPLNNMSPVLKPPALLRRIQPATCWTWGRHSTRTESYEFTCIGRAAQVQQPYQPHVL